MGLYQFRIERLTEIARATMTEVGPVELDASWEELIDDESESALIISEVDLPRLVTAILDAATAHDPQHGSWHAEALAGLSVHDGCQQLIEDLTAERNDVIATILEAKQTLKNDFYVGEFGTHYVNVETMLDALRPTLHSASVRWRVLEDPDTCPVCNAHVPAWSYLSEHHEECNLEEQKAVLLGRRDDLIAAHVLCAEIGAALVEHTRLCLSRVEQIVIEIGDQSQYFADGIGVEPDSVIDAFDVADLRVELDPSSPVTLALATFPALAD